MLVSHPSHWPWAPTAGGQMDQKYDYGFLLRARDLYSALNLAIDSLLRNRGVGVLSAPPSLSGNICLAVSVRR
jgi:hypothetical protein